MLKGKRAYIFVHYNIVVKIQAAETRNMLVDVLILMHYFTFVKPLILQEPDPSFTFDLVHRISEHYVD